MTKQIHINLFPPKNIESKRKNKLPSAKRIRQYWNDKLLKIGVDISHHFVKACFACGWFLDTQRAHIVPDSQGGNNTESNLHILCRNCHADSENLWGGLYWRWLINTHKKQYHDDIYYTAQKLSKLEISKDLLKMKNAEEQKKLFSILCEGGVDEKDFLKKMGIKNNNKSS